MTYVRIGASLTILALMSAAVGPAQEKSNEMVFVKYDGLKQEVLKQRGKVVLVDFWAGY